MKLYRIVHEDYASFYDAFSGIGASRWGGRWNGKGHPAVYTSSTLKTAVAEKSFYSIINQAYVLKNKVRLTEFEIKSLLDRPYMLIEAQFKVGSVVQNDLKNPLVLQQKNREASLPVFSPEESILCPWQKLPLRWTSRLGAHLHLSGEEGCTTLSARGRGGNNFVFYNDHYLLTEIKLINKEEILLSVTNPSGTSKWKRRGPFSLNHAHFKCRQSARVGVVKVLNRRVRLYSQV